jgi:hypothetical protein
MARGSPTGVPCDVWREHYQYNSASYDATPTGDNQWVEQGHIDSMPARTAHRYDVTAYGPAPANAISDSWIIHLRQRQFQI